MIIGIFHEGSGIGNQLHRYVMTRTLAADKGLDFGMVGNFKGKDFLDLDMGKPVPFSYRVEYPSGKVVVECDWPIFQEDTSDYDWRVKEIQDNTIIDGEFQGEEYFEHRLPEIKKWLKTNGFWSYIHPITCVINFRGGEYAGVPELFLPQSYWDEAIAMIKEIEPRVKFEVHTDDPVTARRFFPEYPAFTDAEMNWKAIQNASYLILSNSSFAILPALINHKAKKIIAPKGWARRNTGEQMLKYNVYKKFTHI